MQPFFIIIWGSRNRITEIGRGQFNCPNCGKERPYLHKEAKRWFTLYYIPVFPTQSLGDFIECQGCNMAFKTEVLHHKPKRVMQVASAAEQLNTLRPRLENGYSIEYAVRDLVMAGIDREVALANVQQISGNETQTCPECQLTYLKQVTKCSDCGADFKKAPSASDA